MKRGYCIHDWADGRQRLRVSMQKFRMTCGVKLWKADGLSSYSSNVVDSENRSLI
jgi:hypothetical protein